MEPINSIVQIICPNCGEQVPNEPQCRNCGTIFNLAPSLGIAGSFLQGMPSNVTEVSSVNVSPDLDPRLQKIVANCKQGARKSPTSSTGTDEVAVIAKVTDLEAWEALSEVTIGAEIGVDENEEGKKVTLVTARIPIGRVEYVRAQPFVESLKPAQRLKAELDKTIEEIGARADLLPDGNIGDGGRNTLVGIVDSGCDFAHENFINPDGTTRILAIWDQTQGPNASAPFKFGKLHTRAAINQALQQSDPYTALGYRPAAASHGTHVMDIAAGNGRGSGIPGVAPNADIVFVQVASSDIPWDGPDSVGKSFGDSVQLLEALKFIFDFAEDRPCVINVSLGTNGGPHDGSTLVEQGIDVLLNQAPNRAVCIAASNSFSDGIHAAGKVPAGGTLDIPWNLPLNDTTSNEFELWYPGADRLGLEVIAPDGRSLLKIDPGGASQALKNGNRIVLFATNRLTDPNNKDNMIGVFLEQGLPSGQWTVRLHGITVNDGSFHAWIERDDDSQSNFEEPLDNTHTIGSISCGRQTIVVGSYDAHKTSLPVSFFSSAGPTRDNREKPEVSAPGHAVLAANARSKTGVISKSGTSMASPAATGTVALILSEARAKNKSLDSNEIRDIFISTARRIPPPGNKWDERFGHGRISASAGVSKV